MTPPMSDADATHLAAAIAADKREEQIRRIADQLGTLCVIERPTFYVALEALKHTVLDLTTTMLLMPSLDDATIIRRVELAVKETQDLYRLTAALAREIYERGPQAALTELRQNIATLNAHLPPVEHTVHDDPQ